MYVYVCVVMCLDVEWITSKNKFLQCDILLQSTSIRKRPIVSNAACFLRFYENKREKNQT
jgi:hypothetical protein